MKNNEDPEQSAELPSRLKFGGGWGKGFTPRNAGLSGAELEIRNKVLARTPPPQSEAEPIQTGNGDPLVILQPRATTFRKQFLKPRAQEERPHQPLKPSQRFRVGDWECPECHYYCFGKHTTCPECRAPRPGLQTFKRLNLSTEGIAIRKLGNEPSSQTVDSSIEASRGTTRPVTSRGRASLFHYQRSNDSPTEQRKVATTENARSTRRQPALDEGKSMEKPSNQDNQAFRSGRRALRIPAEATPSPSEKYAKNIKPNRRQRVWDEEDDFEDEAENSRRQAREARKREKKEKKASARRRQAAKRCPIYLPEFISVNNLADVLGIRPARFLEKLEELGFEDVSPAHVLDAETAGLIASEYNFDPQTEPPGDDLSAAPEAEDKSILPSRPPVVTIMGHVDHGKTTLLDWLRKSSIAASEHGGITQHIGAFSVPMPSGKVITFLDTPGHAAFLDMRRRGANMTDIVILVVAADESVKPQTIEAIKHAKEANVPIIVAVNKMDKEGVNPEIVKQDLARYGVDVEDYGGDVQAIPVSGKTGMGMLDLEEAVVTLSEMLDHRADRNSNAEGWVVEATTTKLGRVATVLVRRGTLRTGDVLVAGMTWARIRSMRNEAGNIIEEATPGMPVVVDGWRDQPEAGSEVIQATSEQHAKDVTDYRNEKEDYQKLGQDMAAINEARKELIERRRREAEAEVHGRHETYSDTQNAVPSGPKPVNFIIKADVSGSVEAVVNSVTAVGNNEVYAHVLRSGVGAIGEFDIEHAAVSEADIISFGMAIDPAISRMAEGLCVRILDHNIIYELIDNVKLRMSEHLPPIITQRVTGEAEISQIFDITVKGRKTTSIAGCKVRNGVISRSKKVRVLRDKEITYDGKTLA